MTKLEQAARQALLYLEAFSAGETVKPYESEEAITALREALADQAEQKPVAWHHPKCDGQCIACLIEKAVEDAYGTQGRDYMLRHINAAPVRTKDLTDDEILEADNRSHGNTEWTKKKAFARAVIAADREKNK